MINTQHPVDVAIRYYKYTLSLFYIAIIFGRKSTMNSWIRSGRNKRSMRRDTHKKMHTKFKTNGNGLRAAERRAIEQHISKHALAAVGLCGGADAAARRRAAKTNKTTTKMHEKIRFARMVRLLCVSIVRSQFLYYFFFLFVVLDSHR